jgi:PAS domain S-box-containing protein
MPQLRSPEAIAQARLDKLKQYEITNKNIEKELNNLVRLASTICETPISLINLLGANTQFTKARKGWDITEIPREKSFCHYTVKDDDIMVVENAIEDERFAGSPFVQKDPHIRFYAGVPLKTSDGHNIGAICVIDREPRTLTRQQKDSLNMISREVVSRLELIKKNSELKKADIFLQNSSDIQAIIDSQSLVYLELNKEAQSLFNCSYNNMEGTHFGKNIIDDAKKETIISFLRQQKEPRGEYLVRIGNKAGDVIALNLSFTLHKGKWYMTGRDISRRERALRDSEFQKQFSENIINHLPGIFCLTDEEGLLKRWNKNFEELVGKSHSELKDSQLLSHFDSDDSELLEIVLQQVLTTGRGEAEGALETEELGLVPHALTGFRFKMGGQRYIVSIGVDITELRETQDQLKKTLTNMRIGQELADLGSWRWDLKNNSLFWSPKVYDIYDIADVSQKPSVERFMEKVHPDDKPIVEDVLNRITSGDPFIDFEHRLVTEEGEVRWVRHSGQINYTADGSVSHVIGAVQDITSQVAAKKKLEKEKELSDQIINSLPISFFMFDQKGNAIRWNDYFRKATGLNDIKISYMDPLDYFPQDQKERVAEAVKQVYEEGEATVQAKFRNADGTEVPFLYSASLFEGDHETYMIGTGQDISELKEYQEELDQSLKEKEVLLAEIHHRVKNNLAIISGLLQLEAFSVENEHTQKILKNSQMRIQSMATIHEMLYEAENFHDLSFEGFVEQIISSVREVYHQENQKISFSIDIKSINLNINQAVPCGLIINELITNAYKHAFDDKQEGYISIVGEKSDSNIQFTVKDNGEGLPADFSIEKQSSLGFTLISSLISQLGAELTVKSGEGTTFVFSFQQEAVRGSASTLEYA